ncbi:hypothetical protein [Streptomyces synnematoformans]|uniref:Uncharacterized protein n=1 Tax=Streptomyces synnematoformans TaxID=415721 RepID=A0ABN2XBI1_9ACTN
MTTTARSLTEHAAAAAAATVPDETVHAALRLQAEEDFLGHARGNAACTLGDAAGLLDWRYVPAEALPGGEVEEATALVDGGPHKLRYRYDHDREVQSFALVRECTACRHQRVDEVRDLAHLGTLLAEETRP